MPMNLPSSENFGTIPSGSGLSCTNCFIYSANSGLGYFGRASSGSSDCRCSVFNWPVGLFGCFPSFPSFEYSVKFDSPSDPIHDVVFDSVFDWLVGRTDILVSSGFSGCLDFVFNWLIRPSGCFSASLTASILHLTSFIELLAACRRRL